MNFFAEIIIAIGISWGIVAVARGIEKYLESRNIKKVKQGVEK